MNHLLSLSTNKVSSRVVVYSVVSLLASQKMMLPATEKIEPITAIAQSSLIKRAISESLAPLHTSCDLRSKRSFTIHFPRYSNNPPDLKTFQSVLYSFQRHLPLRMEPQLHRHWQYCYARSVGCVGILKDWLTRVLVDALNNGEDTTTIDTLQRCVLTIDRCEQIAIETMEGESVFRENPADVDRLMQLPGLTPEANSKITAAPRSIEQSPAAQLLKPRLPRRLGQRQPVRDPV